MWRAFVGSALGKLFSALLLAVGGYLQYGPDKWAIWLMSWLPVAPQIITTVLFVVAILLFLGVYGPWLSQLFHRHKPPDVTGREACDWIAGESKWAWRKYHWTDNVHVAWMAAPMEFDRSAREGQISVRGQPSQSGTYEKIDRDYWNVAGIDPIDMSRTERKQFKNFKIFENLLAG